jgi:hypothetical protein
VVAWFFGFSGKQPEIPSPEKLSIIDDKAALAAQFRAKVLRDVAGALN